jgi:hypothetical protein
MASFTLSEVIGSPRTRAPTVLKIAFPIAGAITVTVGSPVDLRHIGHAAQPCASLLAMREVEASGLKDADDLANAALGRKGFSRSRRGTTQAPI